MVSLSNSPVGGATRLFAQSQPKSASAVLSSLLIGVRNIAHPTCQQARARLETMLDRNRKEARR